MTAADRGPMADLLHLLGVLALVGTALSLAVAVIWYTVRTPSDDPLRLPAAQGVARAPLDAEQPNAPISLPAAVPAASTTAEPDRTAAAAPAVTEPAQVGASTAQPPPTLPPGFFQPARPVVHEVFGTALDKEPYLALRSRPAREANLLGKLPDGTQLKVINRFGKWQFVEVVQGELKGTEGFVYGKYVRPFGSEFR